MAEQNTILIVDDEQQMRRLLSLHLQKAGYDTEEVASGERALEAVAKKTYRLILLDIMMPGMSGWEACRKIRQTSSVPIIMLTARDEVADKVQGLKLGADDYITKPFEKEELLARVRALLRRSELTYASSRASANSLLQHRGIKVDKKRREAFYQDAALVLTRREYDILYTLIKNPGHVFSRDDLLSLIWSDRNVDDYRTVDTHVKNLREKLRSAGAPAHDILKTVWGVGYKIQ
jgi:DNA-binding response OmpR family regulator